MVVSQAVLDTLKQIGLNLYERKLWVSLLSRGTSNAGELSTLAKVPHSRTYDVLESLADKGFVMVQNAKPLKYVAIEPREALERAKKKIKEDSDTNVQRITQFQSSSALKELERIYKTGVQLIEPGELTGSLKGRSQMHTQMDTLFRDARNNISILTTTQGLQELHSTHGELLRKVASKGVKIRIAIPNSKEGQLIAQKMRGIADVRRLNKIPVAGRMCLVDDSHIVLSLTDDKTHPTQDMALWTQSSHVAKDVFSPMFNMLWQNAETA